MNTNILSQYLTISPAPNGWPKNRSHPTLLCQNFDALNFTPDEPHSITSRERRSNVSSHKRQQGVQKFLLGSFSPDPTENTPCDILTYDRDYVTERLHNRKSSSRLPYINVTFQILFLHCIDKYGSSLVHIHVSGSVRLLVQYFPRINLCNL